MEIRKAQNQDQPEILNLMRQLIEEHRALDPYYKPFAQYRELKKYVRKAITDPKKLLLIAEEGGEIAGYFLGAIEPAPYYSSEKSIGLVADTAVDKQYRRRGILRSLFQEALKWFQKKQLKVIELSVDARNNAAVAAWKKLGFKDYKLRLQFKK